MLFKISKDKTRLISTPYKIKYIIKSEIYDSCYDLTIYDYMNPL